MPLGSVHCSKCNPHAVFFFDFGASRCRFFALQSADRSGVGEWATKEGRVDYASVACTARTRIVLPITKTSILVRRKQSSASSGRQTTGSFSLNEVLSTIGTPVRSRKLSISR